MSLIINLENFDLTIGTGLVLLKDASLKIVYGKNYGLIGRNGIGKSVLLRAISTKTTPFNGKVIDPEITMFHLSQEIIDSELTPLEIILETDTERAELMAKFDNSEEELSENEIEAINLRLDEIDAWGSESRACKILAGLGFNQDDIETKSCNDYSGGWRMRISLARALFMTPDLLILDEPSNHLDLHAVIWLEKYLATYPKTLLLVSHDAGLLNSVTEETLFLTNQKIFRYKGGWSKFQKIMATHQRTLENAKRKGKPRPDKIPDIGEQEKPPRFNFPEPPDKPRQSAIMRFFNVGYRYPETEVNILSGLDFGVYASDRVVLVGKNGAGKSTLMKLLNKEVKPSSGEMDQDYAFRAVCFHQHHLDQLEPEQTPVDYIRTLLPPDLRRENPRQFLGRFGITGDTALQKIKTLSGGQKSRVVFAGLSIQKPHMLLLDEPTNHLDIFALEALAEGIQQFPGGVICISHNQQIVELCGERIWILEDGNVRIFDGNFEAYKRTLG